MKKTLYILFLFLLTISTIKAQKMNRQKIQALKTSYITSYIDLSPSEAEKFWPVYNNHMDKIKALKMSLEGGMMRNGGIDDFSEEKAKDLLEKSIKKESDILTQKKEMIKELSKIISAKKIIKLQKTERDFNRRLLQEYGRRKRKMMN